MFPLSFVGVVFVLVAASVVVTSVVFIVAVAALLFLVMYRFQLTRAAFAHVGLV